MGRDTSNVAPQARQRKSYLGMAQEYATQSRYRLVAILVKLGFYVSNLLRAATRRLADGLTTKCPYVYGSGAHGG